MVELATGSTTTGAGEVVLVAWAGGGLMAGLGGLWLVKCPACKTRVAWNEVRTSDASTWLVKLFALQRCPSCGGSGPRSEHGPLDAHAGDEAASMGASLSNPVQVLGHAIRDAAKRRVADIFRLDPAALSDSAEFGTTLRASFVSDFRRNEFDILLDDVRDVADEVVLREIESEALVIRTVADYCDHMVRCFVSRPAEVRRVLGL